MNTKQIRVEVTTTQVVIQDTTTTYLLTVLEDFDEDNQDELLTPILDGNLNSDGLYTLDETPYNIEEIKTEVSYGSNVWNDIESAAQELTEWVRKDSHEIEDCAPKIEWLIEEEQLAA